MKVKLFESTSSLFKAMLLPLTIALVSADRNKLIIPITVGDGSLIKGGVEGSQRHIDIAYLPKIEMSRAGNSAADTLAGTYINT